MPRSNVVRKIGEPPNSSLENQVKLLQEALRQEKARLNALRRGYDTAIAERDADISFLYAQRHEIFEAGRDAGIREALGNKVVKNPYPKEPGI